MGCSNNQVVKSKKGISNESTGPKETNPDVLIPKTKEPGIKITTESLVIECKEPLTKHYKVIEKLGSGSFGQVFKVKHKITNKIRALKVIKKSALQYQDKKSDILNEIYISSKIEHPNIIKLFEYYIDESNFYVLIEFLTGGELYEQISKFSFYSEKNAAIIIEQVLSAICYLHSKNITHRDLKPENIVLETQDTGDFNLKIIDFGTAIEFDKNVPLTLKIGTAYYIAPEVIKRSYGHKCDIWSIGVLLYILLSGYPPFDGEDDEEIMKSIKKGDYTFDGEEWDNVSDKAKDLVRKLLTYDPEKRISAAEALQDPWIQKQIGVANGDMNLSNLKAQVSNMKHFHEKHKFQQAAVAFLVHQMSSSDLDKKLRSMFKSIDENHDGRLSYEELKKAFKSVFNSNQDFSEEEFDIWVSNIDQDQSGYIEYEEFLRASIDFDTLFNEKNLKSAFDHFDKDGSGELSVDEIKTVLGVAGSSDKEKEIISNIIKEMDQNGDNVISFQEFKDLMKRIK